MTMVYHALLVAAALGVSAPGYAAQDEGNGAAALMRGDYVAAEKTINNERRTFENDADLLLNLAMIYRHTNRPEQARALYRKIMDAPDELLDTPTGPMRAHLIAARALASMGQLAIR